MDAISHYSGVMAAHLANFGMTGPRTIFEGKYGAFNSLSGTPNFDSLTADLGVKFDILNTRIKPIPCGDGNLGPMEGVLAIMRENGLDAENIESIHCRVIPSLIPFIFEFHGDRSRKYRPATVLDAQASLPYCLAIGILKGGKITFEDFDPKNFGNPEIHKLADKVTAEGDESLRGKSICPVDLSCVVTLVTTNGTVFTKRIDHHRGDPRNPMSEDQLIDKFVDCVTGSLSDSRTNDLLAAIDRFETVADVSRFSAMLASDVR